MVFGLTAVRRDYGLRSSSVEEVDGEFAQSGFGCIAPGQARSGDVLLVRAGPAQLHVVILTAEGYLHADAGLRRVVEVPGAVAWPVLSAWRHPDNGVEEEGSLRSLPPPSTENYVGDMIFQVDPSRRREGE